MRAATLQYLKSALFSFCGEIKMQQQLFSSHQQVKQLPLVVSLLTSADLNDKYLTPVFHCLKLNFFTDHRTIHVFN